MDAKSLLLAYLSAVRDAPRAAALFAEDGAIELPYLYSLRVPARFAGRQEIELFLRGLLGLYPDFAFGPDETRVLIDTPDRVYAEYVAHGRAAATGRQVHSLFAGYVVAKGGRIVLLREAFNVFAMAQAQLPALKAGQG